MVPRDRNALQKWVVPLVAVLLAVVVVAPPLAVAGVAGMPTGPVAGTTTGTSTPDAPSFLQNNLTEARGDVVTVTVDVNNSTEATLRVGPGDDTASNVTAEIAVEDRDSDGRVAVRLNTYALGTGDDGAVAARGEDVAEVRRSTPLDAPLRAGNYSLTLLVGNETVDEATLVIEPASLDGLALRVANSSVTADLSSRAEIRTAVENGTVHESDRASLGDTVVLELEASGLSGPLASQPGPNATVRFLALLDEPGFSLTVRENESSINLEEEGNAFSLTPDGATVVPHATNDTYYVLLDLARLPRRTFTDPGGTAQVEAGDVFDVNVTVTPESGVFERRQSVESRVTVRRGEVTVDAPIDVASGPNQTVEVTTMLPEGTAVGVVVEDTDSGFRAGRTVTVGESGRFVARFDFTNLSVGDRLHLYVQLGDADDPLVLYFEHNAVRVTERGTPTAPPTTTATATTSSPEATATAAPSSDDGGGAIPGFGTVGALVAGAAAVAMTALRRSR